VGVGRRIYENIRNAMSYLLAVHIPLAGMGLLPLLLGWPLLLFPLHVVFIEFVIDPACSLVFEAEQRGAEVMRRPPRDPGQRLFSTSMVLESAALGVTSLIATLLVYGGALYFLAPDEARALGFVTLIAGNLMLILVNRSRDDSLVTVLARPNAAFGWICGLAAAALTVVLAVPPVAEAFTFGRPPVLGVLGAAVLGGAVVSVSGYLRRTRRQQTGRGAANAGRP
jgi:Ca2+-transporting ATPase